VRKKHSFPIKPLTPTISPYCTALTGWTHAKLMKQGLEFKQVLSLLQKHGSRNRLLVVDSDNELAIIRSHCARLSLEDPFGADVSMLNISTLFNLAKISLEQKLAAFDMEFAGIPHRAEDDAHNIALLFFALTEHLRLLFPEKVVTIES
jgi:inhibitor of KinA sporulation pathway (predicted exonuclease)